MSDESTAIGESVLTHLRAFCLTGGEEAARGIRAIRTTQRGEIRMSPEARWIPFTANEFIDATRSSFCWEARLDPGKIGSPTVIDAYENGHGRLQVKLGGIVPVHKITGPDADKGEIQRYLASVVFCPPMLLNHPTLEWTAIGASTLSLRDREDSTGAEIDLDLSEAGCPLALRAIRPRLEGKQAILTPWLGTCNELREYEGLRVPTHLEVAWDLPAGVFTYFRAEITSFIALR